MSSKQEDAYMHSNEASTDYAELVNDITGEVLAATASTNQEPKLVSDVDNELDWPAWLFIFISILGMILLGIVNPVSIVIIVAAFVPGIAVMYFLYFRTRRKHAGLGQVINMYAGGFVPGMAFAFILEMIFQGVVGLLKLQIYGLDEIAKRLKEATDKENPPTDIHWDDLIWYAVTAYLIFGFIEELMKYLMVRQRCLSTPVCVPGHYHGVQSAWGILIYMVSVALGFSAVENIEYSIAGGGGGAAILVIGLRTFLSTPVHALCACLTAIQLIHNDFKEPLPLWKILFPAVFVHGTFDFALFTFSNPFFGTLGFLLSMCSAISINFITAVYCYTKIHSLQLDTLVKQNGGVSINTATTFSSSAVTPAVASAVVDTVSIDIQDGNVNI